MGDWSSIEYIISQSLVVIGYVIAIVVFNIKKRSVILSLMMVSNLVYSVAYILLSAWAGLGICAVAFARNSTNFVFHRVRSEQDRKRMFLIDWILLFFWCAASIVITAFAFDGILSLLPLFALLMFTFAVCQSNIIVFKGIAIPCSVCWIVYSLYIGSVMGWVLESVLLVAIVFGLVRFIKSGRMANANINAA